MTSLTITLDDELYAVAKKRCDAQGGRSVSSLVREAVTEKLGRETPQNPKDPTNQAARAAGRDNASRKEGV